MMEPRSRHNPFPGLRPYEPDEDHLFFGREKEIDDLLRRLSAVRFLPVIGTYIAGALPVLVQFVDSPPKALIILIFVILYQQIENYFLLPRVTARTMDLHPAIAFGAAIAGGAVLGAVGAILAIPAAAMAQAVVSNFGERHEVIDSHLTSTQPVRRVSRRERRVATGRQDGEP